jgi:hypothetical protein
MATKTLAVAGVLFLASASFAGAQAQQSTTSQPAVKPAASANAQQKAAEDLQRASQRLRDALATLEKEAPGPNRATAIKAARDALQNTHDTMARLQVESIAIDRADRNRCHRYAPVARGVAEAPAFRLGRAV